MRSLKRWEAGRLAPTDALLPALATGLGVDPDALGYLDVSAVCAAFGRRLRDLRTERGLTQAGLARRTGFVNRTSIGTCEHGGSDPQLTTIERLARGLRVRPRELIEDSDG
ncbi:MAG TPA: helix-turn-helix transcriptional regulator [Solirubrobacteraceae bacterium]|nr:helix-turn-helix transcriptional regulator [Solirubrobacteraceae bacterium]